MDKGAKEDRANGVMCVAAALFKPMAYKQFRRKWDRMPAGWGANAFHANKFYPGGGDFKRTLADGVTPDPVLVTRYERDSRLIPSLIATHVHELFVVSFLRDEFEHMAPLAWRHQFGGVHRVAAQMMAGRIGHWANQTNFVGDIRYLFYADTLAVDHNPRPPRKDMGALHQELEARGRKVHCHLFVNDALDKFLLDNGCTRREP